MLESEISKKILQYLKAMPRCFAWKERSGAQRKVQKKLHCGHSKADQIRAKALEHLARQLFDKERQKYFFAFAGSNRSVKEKMSE